MADPVIIEVQLDTNKVDSAAREIDSKLNTTLKRTQSAAQSAGNALDTGLQAASQRAKELSSALSGLSGLGPLLAGGIGAAVTALGAGLLNVAKQTAATVGALDDLSTKTGLSTQTLSALRVTLDQNDSSLGQFSESMTVFLRRLGDAQAGNKTLADSFRKLGIDINSNAEDALRKVVERYAQLPNDTQKATFAQQVFGRSGADLKVTLDSLNGNLDGYIKKMSDLGLTVTPEAAKQAADFDDKLKVLDRQFEALKIRLGIAVIPAFSDLATELTKVVGVFTNANSSAGDYLKTLEKITRFLPIPGQAVLGRRNSPFLSGPSQPPSDILKEIEPDVLTFIMSGGATPKPNPLPDDLLKRGKARLSELDEALQKLDKLQKANDALSDTMSKQRQIAIETAIEEDRRKKINEEIKAIVEATIAAAKLGFDRNGLPNTAAAGPIIFNDSSDVQRTIKDLGLQQSQLDELKRSEEEVTDFRREQTKAAREAQEAQKKLVELAQKNDPVVQFFDGLAHGVNTTAEAFNELGRNIGKAFSNVTDLLGGLGNAFKTFVNDLIGNALRAATSQAFGALFGVLGISGGGAGTLGGFGGLGGGTFGGSIFGPASVTQQAAQIQQINGVIDRATRGIGGSAPPLGMSSDDFARDLGGSLNRAFGGTLGKITSVAKAAAPGIGGLLGSLVGGGSAAGGLIGSLGGLIAGSSFTGGLFGISALGGPLGLAIGAGVAGIGALVGLISGAKQRGKDEEVAGQLEKQAYDAIVAINAAVISDQVVGADAARALFESQVIGPFQQQISTLKTKSVVQSRLKNTVANLRRDFENLVINRSIADQARRIADQQAAAVAEQARQQQAASNFARQIPEFASGGFVVPGLNVGRDSVRAMLTPGEMVLNAGQQAAIRYLAGGDVFSRVGVPNAGQDAGGGAQAFAGGGMAQRWDDQTIQLSLDVSVGMSTSGAEEIAVTGMSTPSGRRVIVNQLSGARLSREL